MEILSNENGKYVIEDSAFKDIAQAACLKVDDVCPSKNDKSFCVVKVNKNNELSLTLQIRIRQGANVDKVCNKIQDEVSEVLLLMTGIECNNINIDIQGFFQK